MEAEQQEPDPIAESNARAVATLAAAGWQPMPGWSEHGGYVHGPHVGGVNPWGHPQFKGWMWRLPGEALYSDDTPDTPHEAAAWLVEHARKLFGEQAKPPLADEASVLVETAPGVLEAPSDPEAAAIAEVEQLFDPAPEPQDTPQDEPTEAHLSEPVGADVEEAAGGDQGSAAQADADGTWAEGAEGVAGEGGDPIDAEFWTEELERDPQPLEADDLADLPLIEGADLGAEILAEEAEALGETPQDRFYGLDDLDRRRSLRIGDVVQLSIAKQDAIWTASGTTEGEFRDLTGHVMHDTIDGRYIGPGAVFDRFNELQTYVNAAAAVQQAERAKVAFLQAADRAALEAFDPAADWPLF